MATGHLVPPEQVGYGLATDDKLCARCTNFLPEDEACMRVRGVIDPAGTCDLWQEKGVQFDPAMLFAPEGYNAG